VQHSFPTRRSSDLVVTGAEGSSFSWTVGTVGPAAGWIAAYTGVDTSDPIAAVADREDASNVNEDGTADDNLGPSLNTSPVASGRLFYVRPVRKNPSGAIANLTSPDDGTGTTGDVDRRANIGRISQSGATGYTICLFDSTTNFSSAGTYPGADIRCDISESTNWFFTFAL